MRSFGNRHPRQLVIATIAAALAVWVLRRPDQLISPYAWVEEAPIITTWQQLGTLRQAVHPINGQLILSTTGSVAVILRLDLLLFPVLAYVAASLWFLALLLIWLLPSSRMALELRSALVIAMVLVPANPETFGVLEYSFWWVTLWVVPCLFWDKARYWLRAPVLILAGLSSITASLLFPGFGLLWLARRRLHDLLSAGILLSTCLLQVFIYFNASRSSQIPLVAGDILGQAFANVGWYLLGWLSTAEFSYRVFLGIVAVGAGAGLAWCSRTRVPDRALDWTLLLLIFSVFTVLSSIPAPRISDPYVAGPRYFFLPFMAISWLAVFLVSNPWPRRGGQIGTVFLIVSLVTLAPAWSRRSEHIDWQREVIAACQPGGDGKVRVHYDGTLANTWTATLTPQTCQKILGQ